MLSSLLVVSRWGDQMLIKCTTLFLCTIAMSSSLHIRGTPCNASIVNITVTSLTPMCVQNYPVPLISIPMQCTSAHGTFQCTILLFQINCKHAMQYLAAQLNRSHHNLVAHVMPFEQCPMSLFKLQKYP